jgi:hypothetical protein
LFSLVMAGILLFEVRAAALVGGRRVASVRAPD